MTKQSKQFYCFCFVKVMKILQFLIYDHSNVITSSKTHIWTEFANETHSAKLTEEVRLVA